MASLTPASPFSVPLFETAPPHPDERPTARPASTTRTRRDVNGFPTIARVTSLPLADTHLLRDGGTNRQSAARIAKSRHRAPG